MHGEMLRHVGQSASGDGGVVPSDSALGHVNVVAFPRYPFAHETEHDNPRRTFEHADTSYMYSIAGEDSAAHLVMAVHVGRLPAGSVLPSTLSLGQVYVDVSAPV